jgi:DNA-binding beta-propeller fold protein YncE
MNHWFAYVVLAICFSASAQAGTYTIETIAGTGRPGNNGDAGPAMQTNIDQPFGVEVGPDGALYITEVGQHRVRRLDLQSGQLTTVAGCGQKGYAGDGGPATEALLNEPYEVRFDPQGNMVFVEMQNHIVRRVDRKTGVIQTIAGTGHPGYGGDGGPATKAEFRQPHSIAFDRVGALYIADIGNHRVRRINPETDVIQSIAGTGEKKLPVSGSKAAGQAIFGPRALVVDGPWLWIALREGNSVWRLNFESGLIAHVAGSGKKGFSGDGGNPLAATFDGPKGIAIDPGGSMAVMDTENQAVRQIDLGLGIIRTIAGQGPKARGFGGDGGSASEALFDRPHGICTANDGSIYVGDTNNHRVRRLRPAKGGAGRP